MPTHIATSTRSTPRQCRHRMKMYRYSMGQWPSGTSRSPRGDRPSPAARDGYWMTNHEERVRLGTYRRTSGSIWRLGTDGGFG